MGSITIIPRLTGYKEAVTHDCPRCGGVVRAVYERTGAVAEALTESDIVRQWAVRGFAGGVALINYDHHPRPSYDYFWRHGRQSYAPRPCELELLTDFAALSVAQELYERVLSYRHRPAKHRIVDFDMAALLGRPWIFWATARVSGWEPLALVPSEHILRSMVFYRSAAMEQAAVPWQEDEEIGNRFLADIKAVTERVTR